MTINYPFIPLHLCGIKVPIKSFLPSNHQNPIITLVFTYVSRDRQRFGLGLAGLALSKPNRLSLNRLMVLKPEPNRSLNRFLCNLSHFHTLSGSLLASLMHNAQILPNIHTHTSHYFCRLGNLSCYISRKGGGGFIL